MKYRSAQADHLEIVKHPKILFFNQTLCSFLLLLQFDLLNSDSIKSKMRNGNFDQIFKKYVNYKKMYKLIDEIWDSQQQKKKHIEI